jgi:prephenate dehydratase
MTRPRVAHYGNPGANTEEAALAIFGPSETVPCATFAAIFEAVAAGTVEFGVVAVENSQAGSINDTYDLLLTHREAVTIRGEFDLWVHHYLLASAGGRFVRRSPSPSRTRRRWRRRMASWRGTGIRGEIGGDTAGSARRVREEGDSRPGGDRRVARR